MVPCEHSSPGEGEERIPLSDVTSFIAEQLATRKMLEAEGLYTPRPGSWYSVAGDLAYFNLRSCAHCMHPLGGRVVREPTYIEAERVDPIHGRKIDGVIEIPNGKLDVGLVSGLSAPPVVDDIVNICIWGSSKLLIAQGYSAAEVAGDTLRVILEAHQRVFVSSDIERDRKLYDLVIDAFRPYFGDPQMNLSSLAEVLQ